MPWADRIRSLMITALAIFVGTLPHAQHGAWSPRTLIGIGIAVQLLLLAARFYARRLEQQNDMPGAFTPTVMQVATKFTDGVTVLMCALAFYGGLFSSYAQI
jgi:hypothetical protein